MSGHVRIEEKESGELVYRVTSHRRTITETDIVNFVNLVGLHEPPFIDMEWVEKMPGIHNKRFAPAPLLISLGMGLVATSIMEVVDAITAREGLGRFHGMVGVVVGPFRRFMAGEHLIESLGSGIAQPSLFILLVDVKVPFSEMAGGVALFLKNLGQRNFLFWHVSHISKGDSISIWVAAREAVSSGW